MPHFHREIVKALAMSPRNWYCGCFHQVKVKATLLKGVQNPFLSDISIAFTLGHKTSKSALYINPQVLVQGEVRSDSVSYVSAPSLKPQSKISTFAHCQNYIFLRGKIKLQIYHSGVSSNVIESFSVKYNTYFGHETYERLMRFVHYERFEGSELLVFRGRNTVPQVGTCLV